MNDKRFSLWRFALAFLMTSWTLLPGPLVADPYESAFDELKGPAALTSPSYQQDVIQQNFLGSPEAALPFLMQRLWRKPTSDSFQGRQSAEMDLAAVRAVLAAMPVSVQERTAKLTADSPYKKARLLEAMAEFRTASAVDALELALSDQRVAGLEGGNPEGWPLRVCDVAYNTLTYRLQLDDFRSPLGIAYSYAQRDRWIGRLAEWLKTSKDQAVAAFAARQ